MVNVKSLLQAWMAMEMKLLLAQMSLGILMKLKITRCCHVDCTLTMEPGLITKIVMVGQMVVISMETAVQNKCPVEKMLA